MTQAKETARAGGTGRNGHEAGIDTVDYTSAGNTVEAFRDAIAAAGITPPEYIKADGRIHRFRIEGDKRGSRNGWYVLHLDGARPAGAFGSWKLGMQSTWAAGADRASMTPAERARIQAFVAEAKAKESAETRARHAQAAELARAEWDAAEPASPEHPYLIAKHVKPHGLRQRGGLLRVPLYDHCGLLWSVQRIGPDGSKRFASGGRIKATFSPIGDLTCPAEILICEGWATGATLHEETGHPVLCAMNAGNLLPVAKAARAAWPGAGLVLCADNDTRTPGNPGVTAATAAARATGARLAIPEFPEGAEGSDFNDLAALRRKGGRHG